jgi:hypothetical protein
MKALTTLLVTGLFAATASAGDIYHGFAAGNAELYAWQSSASDEMAGVQPGVGDSRRGYADKGALFRGGRDADRATKSWDIYNGFESTDLSPNR